MWLVWIIASICVGNEYVVPAFGDTVKEAFALFADAFFWHAFANTLLRVGIAFFVSFILGGFCAALGAAFKPFGIFLKPIVAFLRTLPTMSVVLLLSIWSMWITPRVTPLIIAMLVLFPMVYSQFCAAIEQVDESLLQMAQVYEFTGAQKLKNIVLPLAAPYILSHVGSDLSFGIKITVSAEVMAYTFTSMGGLMQDAALFLQTGKLAALTLFTVFAGILIEMIFFFINKCVFRWRRQNDVDRA